MLDKRVCRAARKQRGRALNLRQNMRCARQVGFAGRFLDIELFDDAVLDQRRIAARAHAETAGRGVEVEPRRLGEVGRPVGEEVDVALRPRAFQFCGL